MQTTIVVLLNVRRYEVDDRERRDGNYYTDNGVQDCVLGGRNLLRITIGYHIPEATYYDHYYRYGAYDEDQRVGDALEYVVDIGIAAGITAGIAGPFGNRSTGISQEVIVTCEMD
jgi:hypothetical protein